jgi:hypothetical protein
MLAIGLGSKVFGVGSDSAGTLNLKNGEKDLRREPQRHRDRREDETEREVG